MASWWQTAEAALRPIPHAVVGAVAANEYMPQRHTRDIDLAVAMSDTRALRAHLDVQGWRRIGALTLRPPLRGDGYLTPEGHDVDVLYLPAQFEGAIAAAQRNRVDDMPMATLPWLAVLKLHSSRTQDLGDLARMLGHQSPQMLSAVRRVVRESGIKPQDLEDLEQLIELGRLEYQQGRKRTRGRRTSRGRP